MTLSNELFARSKKVTPGGVHSPVRSFSSVGGEPIFFKKAQGAKLWDVDGKEYLDFCLSFGPLLLGHRDPEIEEVAIKAISETAWTLGACEPYSLSLAEFITSNIPYIDKIRFVSSGTEAVMSALRIARAATNRKKILKFDGCYHGHMDSLLVKAGSGLAGTPESSSLGIDPSIISNTLISELDNDSEIEEIFNREGKDIACVILEPLPANYGLLIQRNEFIQKVVKLAKTNGSLVIFDEVISGFRTGFTGMAGKLNIKPDLITYGKIIGGGFPVGAYSGREDLMNLIAPAGGVYQAGTLSANPIGMQVGLASLKKCLEKNVYETLSLRTKLFTEKLLKLITQYSDTNWEISTFDSIFWVHQKIDGIIRKISQIPKTNSQTFTKLFHQLLNVGIYFPPSSYEVCFLSLAHTDNILDEYLGNLEKLLKQK